MKLKGVAKLWLKFTRPAIEVGAQADSPEKKSW
jgi:hypothetical protein